MRRRRISEGRVRKRAVCGGATGTSGLCLRTSLLEKEVFFVRVGTSGFNRRLVDTVAWKGGKLESHKE